VPSHRARSLKHPTGSYKTRACARARNYKAPGPARGASGPAKRASQPRCPLQSAPGPARGAIQPRHLSQSAPGPARGASQPRHRLHSAPGPERGASQPRHPLHSTPGPDRGAPRPRHPLRSAPGPARGASQPGHLSQSAPGPAGGASWARRLFAKRTGAHERAPWPWHLTRSTSEPARRGFPATGAPRPRHFLHGAPGLAKGASGLGRPPGLGTCCMAHRISEKGRTAPTPEKERIGAPEKCPTAQHPLRVAEPAKGTPRPEAPPGLDTPGKARRGLREEPPGPDALRIEDRSPWEVFHWRAFIAKQKEGLTFPAPSHHAE